MPKVSAMIDDGEQRLFLVGQLLLGERLACRGRRHDQQAQRAERDGRDSARQNTIRVVGLHRLIPLRS